MKTLTKLCLALLTLASAASAWEEEEFEVFDLVEEINQNFYDYMELKQDCSSSEIRKAYRRLSLVLHPDKNPAEDAEIKFRWLVGVYETLKDAKKREIYDRVLIEGLPNWRNPVYYIRRMRKIGLAEGLAYVLVIVTICQYFINWAAYWEKKFTLREVLSAQSKKILKKSEKSGNKMNMKQLEEEMEQESERIIGPKPTMYNLLPFQLWTLMKYLACSPLTIAATIKEAKEVKEAEMKKEQEEMRERQEWEEKKKEKKEQRKNRKKVDHFKEKTSDDSESSEDEETKKSKKNAKADVFNRPKNAEQFWTDADLAKLAKLIKKYPPGLPDRWDKIAEIMERFPWEITKMTKKAKDLGFQVGVSKSAQGITGFEDKQVRDDVLEQNGTQSEEEESDEEEETGSQTDSDDDPYGNVTVATKEDYTPVEVKTKVKTKGGKNQLDNPEAKAENEGSSETANNNAEDWSQAEQKALEAALVQFPKGTQERWDRIASKVPGKSKEQCMVRFKYIAEMVKKRKS